MAHVSLAVLRERELLEEATVASEVRVIQAAMVPAVRGILSDLSEANYQESKITKQTHKAFSCLPGWQRYGSGVTSFRIVKWSDGKVSCQCSSMLSSDLLLKGLIWIQFYAFAGVPT
ncbi:unnamed protein product [Sphagnum tenellum]